MTTHNFERNDPENANRFDDLAADYVAGTMSEPDRAEFESRIADGEHGLLEAMTAFSRVVESVLAEVPPVEPNPAIRESLLKRVNEDNSHSSDTDELPLIIRLASQGPWSETGIPGVSRHVLFADHEQNRVTVLMKMEPGSRFPSHAHAQSEECLMIEGDLDFGDYSLNAGDFLRLAAGTKHGVARTKNGCICLVTTALVA